MSTTLVLCLAMAPLAMFLLANALVSVAETWWRKHRG